MDASGRLYVSDSFQGTVKCYDGVSLSNLSTLVSYGQLQGQAMLPSSVAIDPFNRLFVVSGNNNRLELLGLDQFLHLTSEPLDTILSTGSNLVLKVIAGGGSAFTYQWIKDGLPMVEGGNISGATNGTLTLTSLTSLDGGNYAVVITGPSQTLTSSVTQVAVSTPPSIYAEPASETVFRGTPVMLQVGATGSALSYQWQHNGIDMDGGTNSTLSIASAEVGNSGSYQAFARNATGTAVSKPATVTVLSPPLAMQIQALDFLADGSLSLFINSDVGQNYSLDSSTNLVDWSSVSSFQNNQGLLELNTPNMMDSNARFYRLRWLPH